MFVCRSILFFVLSLSLYSQEKPQTISDFDNVIPAQKWIRSGTVEMRLADGRPKAGKALKLTFPDNKGFVYTPSNIFNFKPYPFDHVSFWLYRDENNAEEAVFEFQIMDKNNKSRFWRKVATKHTGWKQFKLPLRWFRWAGAYSPNWNEISRIAIYPRQKCEFAIDDIQFLDLDKELNNIVDNASDIRDRLNLISDSKLLEKDFIIISESSDIDLNKLSEHLEKALNEIYSRVPSLKPAKGEPKPFLLITKDGEGFKKALKSYGDLHLSVVPGTELSGYSMMNSAFSSYSEKYGSIRPVYLHEFMHALMATQGRILKSHNWIHEGFANYLQMKYQPQQNLSKIIINSMKREDLSKHLLQLTKNDNVTYKDYVYVMMIAETLWDSDKYKEKISEFFEYVEKSGDTDLENILKVIYEKSYEDFFNDLKAYLQKKHS